MRNAVTQLEGSVMQIKKTMERVPGGLMVIPLLLGALCNTFFPNTPKIFGSFTGGLFTGATSILAVYYVCMGATISFKTTPYIIKKGGVLFMAKVGVVAIIGIVVGLGICVVIVTGVVLFVGDRLTGGTGIPPWGDRA